MTMHASSKRFACGDNSLNLNTGWRVSQHGADLSVPLQVPGDIHSALLAAQIITDPYWRDTEPQLDWVHESEWLAQTQFQAQPEPSARYTLTLDSIDTHAIVLLNGQKLGQCESQFLRWDFDVTDALQSGENTLQIHFLSNSAIAIGKAEASDIAIPYLAQNNRLAQFNFLRKTQCHAGWDWGIALSPLGIYGNVTLRRTDTLRFDDVIVRQNHRPDGSVHIEAELVFDVFSAVLAVAELSIDGHTTTVQEQVYPGENRLSVTTIIDKPRLWWPVGEGAQHRYDVSIRLGDETRTMKLGLRTVILDTSADDIGNRFAFNVNGRDMFMRGANWIPADALPARATPEVVSDLLQSAVDANMNMIRIWGGGQYEADWFYDLCDTLGILVWHDFMFACNTYPAHQRAWLDLVEREARYQVRRLSRYACIALWCGDNELVGALGWFEESTNDRDRYLAIYDRLNHTLERAVQDERPDVFWWSSSPSIGRLNFGDGWHSDTAGDMHFWDVWHSAKEFEHYRSVRPRFASEFGFQSLPSMAVIESFTHAEDRNISSKVMDVHQRNQGGNARIVETLQRYFRFPERLDDMVYLSQLSHALAMKTAIEYWRANSPRCMGTLFWQLNDCWPVASWASLEYGGGWKSTHYQARRFFKPLMVTAQPDSNTRDIVLYALNDTAQTHSLQLVLRKVSMSGQIDTINNVTVHSDAGCSTEVVRLADTVLGVNEFLSSTWSDTQGVHHGENDYLPLRPKYYNCGTPQIKVVTQGDQVTLTTDRPALYVTYDHGGQAVYDDNCLTLLPGEPKTLTVLRKRGAKQNNTPHGIWCVDGECL